VAIVLARRDAARRRLRATVTGRPAVSAAGRSMGIHRQRLRIDGGRPYLLFHVPVLATRPRRRPRQKETIVMKVVLFCGGLGLRLRDYADNIPKPMVSIGYRPILWHVMKYYAHFGHKDFILCLGYRGDLIKEYFLNYNEYLSNDFVLSKGGKHLALAQRDIRDWRITFVDTGTTTMIGQRLKAVQHHLHGERVFLANYSDGLSDLSLPALLDYANTQDKVATFVSVRPNLSYHVVYATRDGLVSEIKELARSEIRINAGYFVFKQTIFDYLHADEELVVGPFGRLIREQQLATYLYDGFFAAMDTFKDKQRLDDLYERGKAPWEIWKNGGLSGAEDPNGANGRVPRRSRRPGRHA
jgi:glucose-1-phosphate cytidylyltransferase